MNKWVTIIGWTVTWSGLIVAWAFNYRTRRLIKLNIELRNQLDTLRDRTMRQRLDMIRGSLITCRVFVEEQVTPKYHRERVLSAIQDGLEAATLPLEESADVDD